VIEDVPLVSRPGAGEVRPRPPRPARRHVVVVGTSHRQAPVEVRERLHARPERARAIAVRLAGARGEAAVLSTCNRTEVYVASDDPRAAADSACAELAGLSGLSAGALATAVYTLSGEQAVAHLLRVAAGLDSLVPGEPQILGQVRAAYEQAREARATGPILNRLFGQALRAGKRVRSETELGNHSASVPAAAAELARRALGELSGRRILIIGAGKMSELAAVNLVSREVESIFVANRTLGRARELARRFGGEAVALEHLEDELARADVVISSTRSPRLVLSAEQVARALRGRRRARLVLIDIAVPRDLDPAIAELDGCSLYDIDDLGDVLGGSVNGGRREAERAEAILAEEAAGFREWQVALEVVPAIASLRRRAEEVRVAELARVAGRLRTLSPAERQAVELLTAQIVNKLLHEPTVRMKQAAALPEGMTYAGTVEHLFGLGEEGP
jgi:glutamyl-tRNA reductase